MKKTITLILLGLLCSVGSWGETVDCSGATATSSTGNTNKITSTNYSVYFTRGGGGWGVNSSKGYQGKADAIAVFKLSAAKDVKVIISNSGSKARTFTMTAKPFKTVALGDEFLSILEVSYSGPYKYADCVSSSKNYAGLETTSAFYNTTPATYCTLSNSELSTSISYTTGEQNLAESATSVEYTFDETFPAGVYAVGFSAVSNSNVSLAGFIFSDPDTEAPTCTMSTASPVDVVPSASTDLTVSATHYTSLQWYKGEESDMSDEAIISGATATTYSYTPAVADAGKTYYFRCKALNSNSAAPTTPAVSENVQVNVGALTCATPTITIGDFNFEHKGYKVTITNNEASSTLKVSTDGSVYTTQTSPYVTYATSTTHYYAKAIDKAGYNDSDVEDVNVTNTYDGGKPYIAWVYTSGYGTKSYAFATDPMVIALQEIYNVIEVNGGTSAPSADWGNADLIVCTEAMAGGNSLSNGMKAFAGVTPMIGLKAFNYTKGRWSWGTPANPGSTTQSFMPKSSIYKVLDGVTFEPDGSIKLATVASGNVVQTVQFGTTDCTAPDGNVIMGNIGNSDNKAVMHAATKYFGLGLSCDCWSTYTNNAVTIIKNAAAMLIAGEDLDATDASIARTVTGKIGATGWTTIASTLPLDLSEMTAANTVAAYYAYDAEGTSVMIRTTTATVPAGEGLLLKGTAGDAVTIPVAASGIAIDGNLLEGCTTSTVLTANAAHYVLVNNGGTAEFQSLEENGATIPAGKAYLNLSDVTLAPGALRIVEEEYQATSIEALGATENAVKFIQDGKLFIMRNGVVYDAMGHAVR